MIYFGHSYMISITRARVHLFAHSEIVSSIANLKS